MGKTRTTTTTTTMEVALCVVARELTTLREPTCSPRSTNSTPDRRRLWCRVGAGDDDVQDRGIDLVVACSFADLLPPRVFAVAMAALAPGALLYLPITFAGGTGVSPPTSTAPSTTATTATTATEVRVPSDAVVAEAYHAHLVANEGQFIDTDALVAVLTGSSSSSSNCSNSNNEQQTVAPPPPPPPPPPPLPQSPQTTRRKRRRRWRW